MVGGALIVAAVSIIRGKSSTVIAQEDIRSGQLGRLIIQPAIGEADGQNWPLMIGTMAAARGMLSLALSRIPAWVAQDARSAALRSTSPE